MADPVVSRDEKGRFCRKKKQTVEDKQQKPQEIIDIDHNYVGGGHECIENSTGCPICCPRIGQFIGSSKINTQSDWSSGRRVIEWQVLLENLHHCHFCSLGPLILSTDTVKGEMKCGLGGYIYVQCCSCLELNRVPYGSTHKETPNNRGMPSFSVNTKLGAGEGFFILVVFNNGR